MQEVFTRAWRHAEAYDPTRGSVRTWLYQIARHAIIDTRRRAAVRPALALHEPRDEQDPEGLSIERAMLGWQVAERAGEAHARASPGDPPRPRPRTVGARDRRTARAARGDRQKPHVVRAALAAAGLGGDGGAGMTHVHEDIGAYVLGALDDGCREARARAPRDVPRSARPPTPSWPGSPACSTSRSSPARRTTSRSHRRSRSGCWIASRASAPSRPPRAPLAPADRVGRRRARSWARRSRSPRWSSASTSSSNGGRPPSQYRLALEPVGPAPANASARAGPAHLAGGHRRAPVGQQPAGKPGDVYEVFCDAPGWSASAGTFRVDAKGDALRDPHHRGQEGPVRPDPPRAPRAHRRAARSRPSDILGAKLYLNFAAAGAYPLA